MLICSLLILFSLSFQCAIAVACVDRYDPELPNLAIILEDSALFYKLNNDDLLSMNIGTPSKTHRQKFSPTQRFDFDGVGESIPYTIKYVITTDD